MRPRRVLRPKRKPSSACPRCYRDNEPIGRLTDADAMTFECACGERWITSVSHCIQHADWLGRSHHMRNVGDL